MRDRARDNHGRFAGTVTPGRVLTAMRAADTPVVTARDIADAIGCTPEAVATKLKQLADLDRVDRRTVGGRAVVWWLTQPQPRLDTDGTHDPDAPFFTAPALDGDQIDVADTDEVLGDALANENAG